MTRIKHDKLSMIIMLITYAVLMIIMWFIVKDKQVYIILLITALVMISIQITLQMGNYITYNENELIKHSMFMFTRRIKFEDIKYIKTEHRYSNKNNRRDSVCLWIITSNEGKEIKINIAEFVNIVVAIFNFNLFMTTHSL